MKALIKMAIRARVLCSGGWGRLPQSFGRIPDDPSVAKRLQIIGAIYALAFIGLSFSALAIAICVLASAQFVPAAKVAISLLMLLGGTDAAVIGLCALEQARTGAEFFCSERVPEREE